MHQENDLSQPETQPTPKPPADERRRPVLPLTVALYAALIYLPFLGGDARILTSHEVMVTQPALRLLADGEWVVPHYASGRWLDKPPLVAWLTAISFATLGGFSEFAARLPAALSAIGLCVLVYFLTARCYSRRAALFAGLMQATCVYMFMQGRLGEIDIVFALLLTGAHGVLLWYWGRGQLRLPIGPAVLLYTLAGLAVLAKGALAVALLGSTVLAFCALRRSWRPFRTLLGSPAILAFFLVVVPWHVAAYQIAGETALEQWRYNSLLRFFGLHHLGGKSPLFYFYTVPWLVLPWTIVLIVGAPKLWRDARRKEAWTEHLLWAWFLGGFVFFTLCIFKHKHYIIPSLPPLTILAAHLLDLHYREIGIHRRRALIGLFVALPIVFGVVSGVVIPERDHRGPTVEFLRKQTSQLPADETLYVVGLGQSMAYPYIQHDNCIYLDDPREVVAAIPDHLDATITVLSLRAHLELAETYGLTFVARAGEPVRQKYPLEETMVIGRLSRASAAESAHPTPAPSELP